MPITDPAALFPYFAVRGTTATLTAGQSILIARGNPNRILLTVSGAAAGSVWISPTAIVGGAAPRMIITRVATDFAQFIGSYRTWGATIGWNWYGLSLAGVVVDTIEVIFNPPSEWTAAERNEALSLFDEGTYDRIIASAIES